MNYFLLNCSGNHDDVIDPGPALDLAVCEYGLIIHERQTTKVQLNMVPLHPIGQIQTMANCVFEQANRGLREIINFVDLTLWTSH